MLKIGYLRIVVQFEVHGIDMYGKPVELFKTLTLKVILLDNSELEIPKSPPPTPADTR